MILVEMGRFNMQVMRYLESEHFRVLSAVEMGMKNHELVPLALVAAICNVHRGGVSRLLGDLIKHGLVVHENTKQYEGYRLTFLGYDCLALKALSKRGMVASVGNQIGVGKESDIYVGGDDDNSDLVLKFHRLGRTSFRKVKEKRDYLEKRRFTNWLYLSRLAAGKEFRFMQALYEHGFPVPKPIDNSRHLVLMELVEGETLSQVDHVENVEALFDQLINLVVRLARHGLIHCDLNEFNLMLCDKERPVLIDLPQMVSVDHSNAAQLFDRDVNCLRAFFRRRFHFETETVPVLSDVRRMHRLDVEVEASGYIRPKRTSRQDQGEQKEIEKEKEETIELEEGCADLSLTSNPSETFKTSNDSSETSSNDSEESDDDQEKEEEELSIRSVSTNEKKPMSSDDVRRRLMQQQRSKANKKKLRIKGKAVAIGQARRSNNAVIREAVTDTLWA